MANVLAWPACACPFLHCQLQRSFGRSPHRGAGRPKCLRRRHPRLGASSTGRLVDNVASAAELEVEVREPATRHTVSVQQLRRWCDSIAASPAETIRKAKLKQLLAR